MLIDYRHKECVNKFTKKASKKTIYELMKHQDFLLFVINVAEIMKPYSKRRIYSDTKNSWFL